MWLRVYTAPRQRPRPQGKSAIPLGEITLGDDAAKRWPARYIQKTDQVTSEEYMTAQIPDTILMDEKGFSIVGVNGRELFTPQSVGITPVASMSACWRGYVCKYKVMDRKLILDGLLLSFGFDDMSGKDRKFVPQISPTINGVSPTSKHPTFSNIYEGLNLEIQFTGGILAGDGFIQSLYVHMGFHPAWKYQNVFELIFDNGEVQETRDVSKQVEHIRNTVNKLPLEPDILKLTEKEVESWIEKTFRLDYDLKR